jgi:hypothetical protein
MIGHRNVTRASGNASVAGAASASAGHGGIDNGNLGEEFAGAAGSNGVVAGDVCSAAMNRLDASRCFFEMLVLQNRGYVALQQEGPYQELLLWPTEKTVVTLAKRN